MASYVIITPAHNEAAFVAQIEYPVLEHRLTGSATARHLGLRIQMGDACTPWGDQLFFVIRCLYRVKCRPKVVWNLADFIGYYSSAVRRHPIGLTSDIERHWRLEQREKLSGLLRMPKRCGFSSGAKRREEAPNICRF